jgi:hypothetical protein
VASETGSEISQGRDKRADDALALALSQLADGSAEIVTLRSVIDGLRASVARGEGRGCLRGSGRRRGW